MKYREKEVSRLEWDEDTKHIWNPQKDLILYLELPYNVEVLLN